MHHMSASGCRRALNPRLGCAEEEWGDAEFSGLHPLDVRRALADAGPKLALLWTLPWAARYLWFLPPAASASPYFRCATSPSSPYTVDLKRALKHVNSYIFHDW